MASAPPAASPLASGGSHEDKLHRLKIKSGWSGYCECDAGVRAAESACEHPPVHVRRQVCGAVAFLRKQREQRQDGAGGSAAAEEEFSADDAQSKLYKRGKQFYVMGNTELALRHFREALKLDPEHTATKREYKQAKKLAKLMEKIEAVLGKDVEGKGRQKQLEREEQYEEATLLEDALGDHAARRLPLEPLPRPVHLLDEDARKEEALKHCTKHESHDSGSMASKILHAEALLLNEQYEEAIAEYKKVLEMDEHSKEGGRDCSRRRSCTSDQRRSTTISCSTCRNRRAAARLSARTTSSPSSTIPTRTPTIARRPRSNSRRSRRRMRC